MVYNKTTKSIVVHNKWQSRLWLTTNSNLVCASPHFFFVNYIVLRPCLSFCLAPEKVRISFSLIRTDWSCGKEWNWGKRVFWLFTTWLMTYSLWWTKKLDVSFTFSFTTNCRSSVMWWTTRKRMFPHFICYHNFNQFSFLYCKLLVCLALLDKKFYHKRDANFV